MCADKKTLPDAAAAWDEQWKRNSKDPDLLAQQQKRLEQICAQKAAMQRMKEQAEYQLRQSSAKSAADILKAEEACASLAADKAAQALELRDLRAVIAESKRQMETDHAVSGKGSRPGISPGRKGEQVDETDGPRIVAVYRKRP